MRPSAELRTAVQTIGNAAIGLGLGLSVLWVAVVVSQFASAEQSAARSTPAVSASVLVVVAVSATPAATATPLLASPSPTSATTTAAPATAFPTAAATAASAAPTLAVEPYTNGGRRYAALSAPLGYVYLSPIAGRVLVNTYQLIDGEVRVGSFVPSLPFFPYITVESGDRRVIFRPGALNVDTAMLIKDGERAEPGTPLFKTIGDGASS
ncbi:MAG TPA: hypothetical protein VJP45_11580, partial [Candidatus Limnocylindria bacterium]|nr:hypothetical protein [Candidatus Limnocylindria bacterium]